jgi:accessory gene regulator B
MEKIIDHTLNVYKNNLNIDEGQEAILKYGIYLAYTYILGFCVSLILAQILGIFSYVFVLLVAISTFRNFSGGAHCASMVNCIVFSVVTANFLALFSKLFSVNQVLMLASTIAIFIFALWAVYTYAPADTPAKPITSVTKRKHLRTRSYMVLILWFTVNLGGYLYFGRIHSLVFTSSIGILWQSISLTKFGYRFYNAFDAVFNRFFVKGGNYL